MQKITNAGIKPIEFARSGFVAVAPNGVSLESAIEPEFWTHVARGIKRYDRIELRAEDDTWWADLLVVKAERLALHVRVVATLDLSGAEQGITEDGVPKGYQVSWGGPTHKFRVTRKSDSAILAHGMSKEDAIRWAIEDAKAAA